MVRDISLDPVKFSSLTLLPISQLLAPAVFSDQNSISLTQQHRHLIVLIGPLGIVVRLAFN